MENDQLLSDAPVNTISRKHFRCVNQHAICSNTRCGVKFGFINKGRNCYRCGLVFCGKCLQNKRALSTLAQPDPSGRFYEVCISCCLEPQGMGQIRCWKKQFLSDRNIAKQQHHQIDAVDSSNACSNNSNLPKLNKMNFDNECERLIQGFRKTVGKSELIMFGIDIITSFKTLKWQRSNFKISKKSVNICSQCKLNFSRSPQLKKKVSCSVCGCVVCNNCSTCDLLLYISDEDDSNNPQPRLVIINIVGSPDVEPRVSMSLRVCGACKERVQQAQVDEYYGRCSAPPPDTPPAEDDTRDSPSDTEAERVCERMVDYSKQFTQLRRNIHRQLEQYQDLTHTLQSGESCTVTNSRSIIHILAKAQGDLADHFVSISSLVLSLKKVEGRTPLQSALLQNMMKCYATFYQENKLVYNEMRAELEEITPPRVLESIQTCIDEQAISSTYLSVRQLGLESLLLCDTYRLLDVIPLYLAKAEQEAALDVKSTLARNSAADDWETYQSRCNTFIADVQLKSHRFIKLSTRHQSCARRVAADTLLHRAQQIVARIISELDERCAHNSFSRAKRALSAAQRQILALNAAHILSGGAHYGGDGQNANDN